MIEPWINAPSGVECYLLLRRFYLLATNGHRARRDSGNDEVL